MDGLNDFFKEVNLHWEKWILDQKILDGLGQAYEALLQLAPILSGWTWQTYFHLLGRNLY